MQPHEADVLLATDWVAPPAAYVDGAVRAPPLSLCNVNAVIIFLFCVHVAVLVRSPVLTEELPYVLVCVHVYLRVLVTVSDVRVEAP